MSKFFYLIFIVLSCFTYTKAQISTSSPYSRFGLGELSYNSNPAFTALGNTSVGCNKSGIVNFTNPASYTSFKPNSFLLSTGGWYQNTTIINSFTDQVANNNGFSHLVMGFPVSEKIGASIGMVPFSSTGYEINVRDQINNTDLMYYGDGGISKVYFGGAYKLSDELSLGLNANYLFGNVNRRKKLVYDDPTFLNSRSNSKINLKGYYYEFGVIYEKEREDDSKFALGFTLYNNSSIRVKNNELIESFEFSGILEVPKDTFVNSTIWGDMVLPKNMSFGLSYNKANKWLFVADYSLQDWEQYIMFDQSDNLVNSLRVSSGLEYTPEYNSVHKYYKRINYRFGIAQYNTPLKFSGEQLIERSISFGVGLPIKKSRTKYDFSCTLGERGTTENNLIKEQFVRIGLSVSYDGIWFVKRKYD